VELLEILWRNVCGEGEKTGLAHSGILHCCLSPGGGGLAAVKNPERAKGVWRTNGLKGLGCIGDLPQAVWMSKFLWFLFGFG